MLHDLLFALETSGLGVAMRTSLWLYPTVNTVHLLAAATAFGAMLMADLRLLGVGSRTLPALPLFALGIRLAIGAAVIAVPTGVMLFAADPQVVVASPFFLAKLGLLLALFANALLFHKTGTGEPPGPVIAAVSLVGWTAVLISGRLIAYW